LPEDARSSETWTNARPQLDGERHPLTGSLLDRPFVRSAHHRTISGQGRTHACAQPKAGAEANRLRSLSGRPGMEAIEPAAGGAFTCCEAGTQIRRDSPHQPPRWRAAPRAFPRAPDTPWRPRAAWPRSATRSPAVPPVRRPNHGHTTRQLGRAAGHLRRECMQGRLRPGGPGPGGGCLASGDTRVR